ncbi:MAG: HTTM domain-containing protein [Paracoccaceae bacterium]
MITCFCLLALNVAILHRYDGPYNGGADRMTLLVLVCLSLAHLLPDGDWAELALAYLAFQLVFSYALSGWVKLRNPDWRSGRALVDVFLFSAYPVSEALRGLSDRTRLLFVASWSVIGLEIFFPLALFHPWLLAIALGLTVVFHIANACVFGLNRFLWAWLAAYPSLIWFQARIFD